MRMTPPSIARAAIVVLFTGLLYYAGAWLGVTQTITPEGIAIIWPPNSVLLAAFLLLHYRYWPWIALAAMSAELAADLPAFPVWAALGFGLTNLLETSLAAWLIRRAVGGRFDFDSLRHGASFLLYGPLLAASLAALLGALIYILLGRSDSSYWSLWRLWWFGDALGLLLLTPLIVVFWRWLEQGISRIDWPRVVEFSALAGLLLLVGINTFPQGTEGALGFHLTPILLLPFGLIAALRFGVRGAATVVLLIAAMAIAFMVRGMHPYAGVAPQFAVWLMQEYLAVVALLSIGLALLLHEIRTQRNELERRVRERTRELQHSNRALAEANAQLNELASTDYLTGIANRRHFFEVARRELERTVISGQSLSLLLFDLDHFKRVNDRYGHDAGDHVLQNVCSTVQAAVRPLDLLGRFGGEEFLLLLPGMTLAEAVEVAERLRLEVAALTVPCDQAEIRVTISIGVTGWGPGDELDQLIGRADQALYGAKGAGRNTVYTLAGDAQRG